MSIISPFKADHNILISSKAPEKLSEKKKESSSFVSLGLKALAAGAVWTGYTASQSAPNVPAAEMLRLGGCVVAGAALLADRVLYPQKSGKLSLAAITALFGCVLIQGEASYREFNDALATVNKNKDVIPLEITNQQTIEKSPIAAMFFLKLHEDISSYIGPGSTEIRETYKKIFNKIDRNQAHKILLKSNPFSHTTHFDVDVCATEKEIRNGLVEDTQGTGLWVLNPIPKNEKSPSRTQCYISEPSCADSSLIGGIRIHFVNCSTLSEEEMAEYGRIEEAVASIKNNKPVIENASDILLKSAGYTPSQYLLKNFTGCSQYDSVLTRFLSEDRSQVTEKS